MIACAMASFEVNAGHAQQVLNAQEISTAHGVEQTGGDRQGLPNGIAQLVGARAQGQASPEGVQSWMTAGPGQQSSHVTAGQQSLPVAAGHKSLPVTAGQQSLPVTAGQQSLLGTAGQQSLLGTVGQ